MSNRFFFLGNLQRLDRYGDFARGTIDLGDPGVELVANCKTLDALLGALARQVAPAHKRRGAVVANHHVNAGSLNLLDHTGDNLAALDRVAGVHRILAKLLNAQADPLFVDVDIQHLGLNHLAFGVFGKQFFARLAPVDVGQMHHPVDVAIQANEQTKLGNVLDFALDDRPHGAGLCKGFPRIVEALFQAQRNAPLDRVDFQHLHFDFLGS